MALTSQETANLQRFSIYKEGIAPVSGPADATNIPTILIGLGGAGCATLNRIKQKMLQSTTDSSDHIFYLAIDTDLHDLRDISDSSASGSLTSNEIIHLPIPLPVSEFSFPWFELDPAFVNLPYIHAGGWRQLGRLALLAGNGYHQITDRLSRILHAVSSHVAFTGHPTFHVMLVSGSSGGTGSGMLIDIAYLIHRLFLSTGLPYNLSAYIYTPNLYAADTHLPAPFPNIEQHFANGNAVLQEISAYMRAEENHTPYRLAAEDSLSVGAFACDRNIFHNCFLISPQMYPHNAVADTIGRLSETLIDQLLDTEPTFPMATPVAAVLMQEDNNAAYLCEIARDRDPLLFPEAANDVFKILNHSCVTLSMSECYAYCLNQILDTLNREWTVNAADSCTEADFLDDLRTTCLADTKTLLSCLIERGGLSDDLQFAITEPPHRSDILNDPMIGLKILEPQIRLCQSKLHAFIPSVPVRNLLIDQLEDSFQRILMTYGPFVLTKYIEQCYHHLSELHQQLLIQEHSVDPALAHLQEELSAHVQRVSALFGGQLSRRMQYTECACRIASTRVQKVLLRQTANAISDLLHHLQDPATRHRYDACADTMQFLSAMIREDCMDPDDLQPMSAAVSMLSIRNSNPYSVQLKEVLDQLITPVLVDRYRQDLLSFLGNRTLHADTQLYSREYSDELSQVLTVPLQDSFNALPRSPEEFLLTASHAPQHMSLTDVQNLWDGLHAVQLTRIQDQAAQHLYHMLQDGLAASQENSCSLTLLAMSTDIYQLAASLVSTTAHYPGIHYASFHGARRFTLTREIYGLPLDKCIG